MRISLASPYRISGARFAELRNQQEQNIQWLNSGVHQIRFCSRSVPFRWTIFIVLYCVCHRMPLFGRVPILISHSQKQRVSQYSVLFDVSRNSGNLFGGKLNLTHMGVYSASDKHLNITFTQTTVIRRMDLHGIRVRTMVVVRKQKQRNKKKNV